MPGIVPWQPTLIWDKSPDICARFQAGLRESFRRGWPEMRERHFSNEPTPPDPIATAFPGAQWFSGNGANPFNWTAQDGFSFASAKLDLDHDGTPEALHAETYEVAWRYFGARLYILDSDPVEVTKTTDMDGVETKLLSVPKPPDRREDVFYHWSIGIPIFAFGGAYYTYWSTAHGTGQLHNEDWTQEYSLIRLDGSKAQQEICRVLFYPPQTSLDAVSAQSPFLSGLMPLYGGRRREAQSDEDREGTCDGTAGWAGVDPRSAMMTVFYRPELMLSSYSAPKLVADIDSERERRLLDWATTDPTSWRTYVSMRQDRPNFTGMMQEYYAQKLGYERPEAAILARKAYVFLIDHVLFNYRDSLKSLDGSPVAIVAEPFPHLDDTPGDVADRAIDLALALPNTPASDTFLATRTLDFAMRAAAYTGKSPELLDRLIRPLTAAMLSYPWLLDVPATEIDVRGSLLSRVLLAAMENPPLFQWALAQGADVNAPTNWYGKTALMYAAQLDLPDAAALLLQAGADLNIATDGSGRNCERLARDHRTALMFAAENASPALIRLLLAAGADPRAKDSQGNGVRWYVLQNTRLTTSERDSLLAGLGQD